MRDNGNSDQASELAKGATSTFGGRLSLAISGESPHRFARKAGIPDSTLRKYLSGTSTPGVDNLQAIADAANVTLDWLVAERGPMRRDVSGFAEEEGPVRYSPGLPSDFRLIPRLDVQAAAGPGMVVEYENHQEMVAFRADWLRRRGINPQFANVLTARGDSMEPTIRDGDILLVDTSIDRVVDNAIYVVVFDGRTLVKRVQLRRDGSVVLKSDNSAIFDDEAVPAAEVQSLNVAGRVMWYGRSI